MKKFIAFLLMLFTFNAFASVGYVVSIQPEASVKRNGKIILLKLKSSIEEGDTLITGKGGRVRIMFDDNGAINLGSDTVIALKDVVPTGKKPKFSASITKGMGRFITGEIVKKNPDGYNIKTPQATIGIRGTVFAIEVENDAPGGTKSKSSGGHTVCSVINTAKTVTMNGAQIPSGQKLSSLPGSVPSTITEKELSRLNDLTSVPTPITSNLLRDKNDNNNNAVNDAKLMSDMEKMALIKDIGESKLPMDFNGTIYGNLNSNGFSYLGNQVTQEWGGFGFEVNTGTGEIKNANLSFSGFFDYNGNPETMIYYDVSGGTGTVSGNRFQISNYETASVGTSMPGLAGNETISAKMDGEMTSPGPQTINASGQYEAVIKDIDGNVKFLDQGNFSGSGFSGTPTSIQ